MITPPLVSFLDPNARSQQPGHSVGLTTAESDRRFSGRTLTVNGIKIVTERVSLSRDHEWSAITDNYEAGAPAGFGRTEQAAIDCLFAEMIEARS